MSDLQPKTHLRDFTRHTQGRLVNDLNALSEEQAAASPGGCARTALHIVAECALLNGFIARFLTNGSTERMPPDQRDALLNSFDTREKALAFLAEQTQMLLATIETLDENTLGEVSEALFGRPMSRFAVAQLPAMHMMYHDGQLNYLQTLHGDNDIHW